MLTRRLRRRPNIKTTLGQRLVFAGIICWVSLVATIITNFCFVTIDGHLLLIMLILYDIYSFHIHGHETLCCSLCWDWWSRTKHETVAQCQFNIRPQLATLGQHLPNIGSIPCVFWDIVLMILMKTDGYGYIVASKLKDPICHSNECQIGSFSSEATISIMLCTWCTRLINHYYYD